MWHQVGFLADAFQIFKDHGMSVDLVSTSETNVTVSLDPQANSLDSAQLDALIGALSGLCRVQAIGPCASVSLVGRNIRGILHQLGEAFELFAEQQVYLVSQAANDLNFTFVVDESQGDRLVDQLHELLIPRSRTDRALGPTWDQLFAPQTQTPSPARPAPWWRARRLELQRLMDGRDCAYVYDRATLLKAARALKGVKSAARVLYAMKANPHAQILQLFDAQGLDFDCVSRGEVERLVQAVPQIDKRRILFTPNFIGREEYTWAFEQGVQVTLDSPFPIDNWPKVLAIRSTVAGPVLLSQSRQGDIRLHRGSGSSHMRRTEAKEALQHYTTILCCRQSRDRRRMSSEAETEMSTGLRRGARASCRKLLTTKRTREFSPGRGLDTQ